MDLSGGIPIYSSRKYDTIPIIGAIDPPPPPPKATPPRNQMSSGIPVISGGAGYHPTFAPLTDPSQADYYNSLSDIIPDKKFITGYQTIADGGQIARGILSGVFDPLGVTNTDEAVKKEIDTHNAMVNERARSLTYYQDYLGYKFGPQVVASGMGGKGVAKIAPTAAKVVVDAATLAEIELMGGAMSLVDTSISRSPDLSRYTDEQLVHFALDKTDNGYAHYLSTGGEPLPEAQAVLENVEKQRRQIEQDEVIKRAREAGEPVVTRRVIRDEGAEDTQDEGKTPELDPADKTPIDTSDQSSSSGVAIYADNYKFFNAMTAGMGLTKAQKQKLYSDPATKQWVKDYVSVNGMPVQGQLADAQSAWADSYTPVPRGDMNIKPPSKYEGGSAPPVVKKQPVVVTGDETPEALEYMRKYELSSTEATRLDRWMKRYPKTTIGVSGRGIAGAIQIESGKLVNTPPGFDQVASDDTGTGDPPNLHNEDWYDERYRKADDAKDFNQHYEPDYGRIDSFKKGYGLSERDAQTMDYYLSRFPGTTAGDVGYEDIIIKDGKLVYKPLDFGFSPEKPTSSQITAEPAWKPPSSMTGDTPGITGGADTDPSGGVKPPAVKPGSGGETPGTKTATGDKPFDTTPIKVDTDTTTPVPPASSSTSTDSATTPADTSKKVKQGAGADKQHKGGKEPSKKSKSQTGYLRPGWWRGGQDILRITGKQELQEIKDWDLFDLPIPENDDITNPLYVKSVRQDYYNNYGLHGQYKPQNKNLFNTDKLLKSQDGSFIINDPRKQHRMYDTPERPMYYETAKRYDNMKQPMISQYRIERGSQEMRDPYQRQPYNDLDTAYKHQENIHYDTFERAGVIHPEVANMFHPLTSTLTNSGAGSRRPLNQFDISMATSR